MLTIRLTRVGSKNRPCYRVVAIESGVSRDGRFLELLGHYNPRADPELLDVDYERVSYWTSKGARLSDTVRTLIARHPAPPPKAEASESTSEVVVDAPADSAGADTQVTS